MPKHGLTTPKGFYTAAATCGIKASGLPDLSLIVADRPCAAAGVFTRSRTPAAPVLVTKRHLRTGHARAIVVNSGNANASTGLPGVRDASTMCRWVAQQAAGLSPAALRADADTFSASDVLVASTGLIGAPLPMDKISRGIATACARLAQGPSADAAAARGIMTTDLTPKTAHRLFKLGRKTIQLAGICKGSGMIAPNMATMLAFITTDAAISPALLRRALRHAAAATFNRISVDQHTSPSDMVLALASGAATNQPIKTGRALHAFTAALTDLCSDLAYQIVRDGEGATKVFRVHVTQARSEREADLVARAVVNSPLVKCAVHGSDPNWGRIVTAAGYSGAPINPDRLSLHIGGPDGIEVFHQGTPAKLTAAQLRRLGSLMRKKDILFTLALGRGNASVQWLGCDLSRQYVTINADYST
jgi:glutamate N-acetyltransferase/amino-acid N-acetyltransferase